MQATPISNVLPINAPGQAGPSVSHADAQSSSPFATVFQSKLNVANGSGNAPLTGQSGAVSGGDEQGQSGNGGVSRDSAREPDCANPLPVGAFQFRQGLHSVICHATLSAPSAPSLWSGAQDGPASQSPETAPAFVPDQLLAAFAPTFTTNTTRGKSSSSISGAPRSSNASRALTSASALASLLVLVPSVPATPNTDTQPNSNLLPDKNNTPGVSNNIGTNAFDAFAEETSRNNHPFQDACIATGNKTSASLGPLDVSPTSTPLSALEIPFLTAADSPASQASAPTKSAGAPVQVQPPPPTPDAGLTPNLSNLSLTPDPTSTQNPDPAAQNSNNTNQISSNDDNLNPNQPDSSDATHAPATGLNLQALLDTVAGNSIVNPTAPTMVVTNQGVYNKNGVAGAQGPAANPAANADSSQATALNAGAQPNPKSSAQLNSQTTAGLSSTATGSAVQSAARSASIGPPSPTFHGPLMSRPASVDPSVSGVVPASRSQSKDTSNDAPGNDSNSKSDRGSNGPAGRNDGKGFVQTPDTAPAIAPANNPPASDTNSVSIASRTPVQPQPESGGTLPASSGGTDPRPSLPAPNPPGNSPVVSSAQILDKPGQTEIRIEMQGTSLGSVELRAHIAGDQIGASISVEHHDTQVLLASELPALHSALNEKNLRVDIQSVSQGSFSSMGGGYGGDSGQRSYSQSNSKLTYSGQPETTMTFLDAPAEPAGSNGTSARLSVLA
jgi:hypothetical protein